MKQGEDFLLKKGTSKDSQGFGPYKPFHGPHNKKRGYYRKRPYGGNSSQSSMQLFSSGRGKPNFRGSPGGEGVETPLPNDSLKASLSPPVGGRLRSFRRDWQTNKCSSNMLNIITNGYLLPFVSKPNLVRFPLILSRVQGPSKKPSSGLLYPVSSVKERNRKGGKCKIALVLQSLVPSTQASPKVEASHRPKQAQHFSTRRKVQNGNSQSPSGPP